MKRIAAALPLRSLARSVATWYAGRWFRRSAGPLSVGCYITNRCNLRCAMCTYWRSGTPMEIPLDLFRRIVDDLARLGTYYFSITGGEPFMLGDVMERVAYASRRLPYVHLVTNGLLMDASAARALAASGLHEVSVSVDGFAAFHDRLRGRAGAYDRAMNAIDLLKTHAPKVYIVTNTVIAAENLDEILPLVDLFGTMGLYSKLQPVNRHPSFPGTDAAPAAEFAAPEPGRLGEVVRGLASRRHVINSRYFLSKVPEYFGGRPLMEPGFKCLVPDFHLEVLWDSRAYPCLTGMDWQGGFDAAEGLARIVRRDDYTSLQRRLERCRKCDRNLQICYWEPRVLFPFGCYLRYSVLGRGRGRLSGRGRP